MHHNDNEFDRVFSDRLRNHSSPVRGDLWRRIHTGLGTSAPRLHPLRFWRYLGAGAATLSVAFAATLIFTPKHGTKSQLNHYSKISASTSRHSDSQNADPQHSDSIALNLTPTPDRNQPPVSGPVNPVPAPENHDSAIAKTESPTPANPETSPRANLSATRDKPANHTDLANRTNHPSRNHLANRGSKPATPSANLASNPIVVQRHTHHPVTLPEVARLAAPPAISARRTIPTRAQTLAGKSKSAISSKSPITLHPRAPFHPFKYISVYGSPDFPNKDFDFSWTAGARFTYQFARHWSITTGVQYEQLNVPTADVGGQPTMPFHFSNLSIPLLAGYRTSFSRYNLTVTSGIFIHAYAKAIGSNTYNEGIGVPTDRNTNTFALGFDLERPVNNRWAVFIQPYLREEIFNGEIFIPAQSITNGVLLGGRYHL